MSEADIHAASPSRNDAFLTQIQEAISPAVAALSAGEGIRPPGPAHNPYPGGHPVAEVWINILSWAMHTGTWEFALLPNTGGMTLEGGQQGQRVRLMQFPESLQFALTARFKSGACLDMTVRDKPQHGTMPLHYRVDDRVYSMHLQTIPTNWGERLEICIHPPSAIDLAASELVSEGA